MHHWSTKIACFRTCIYIWEHKKRFNRYFKLERKQNKIKIIPLKTRCVLVPDVLPVLNDNYHGITMLLPWYMSKNMVLPRYMTQTPLYYRDFMSKKIQMSKIITSMELFGTFLFLYIFSQWQFLHLKWLESPLRILQRRYYSPSQPKLTL